MKPRVYAAPGRRIELTPSDWQDEASIAADLARSEDLTRRLAADGVQSWRSYYRWVGPIKLQIAKEVGPPPWRLPRVGLWARRGPVSVSAVAGWRSTAYRLIIMWARKPR